MPDHSRPVLVNGEPALGITVGNVPLGTDAYVLEYLKSKQKFILRGFLKIMKILDTRRFPHPELPVRQMLWNLTLQCLQFMGDYWLRHLRPDLTESFALALDNGVNSLVESTIGFSLGNLTPFAKERLRLPVQLKGMGLR